MVREYSVVLCTYNGSFYIKEQIYSILNQTVKPKEIYIFDDGSNDDTIKIIKKIDSEIKIKIKINKKNLGYAKNFDSGIKSISAEVIALCDQDDFWLPNKAELILNEMDYNTEMVFSDAYLVDEKLNMLEKKLSELGHIKKVPTFNNQICKDFIVTGATVFINRDFVLSIPELPENIPHDAWYSICSAIKRKIKYINKPLILYRQHSNNLIGIKETTSISSKKKVLQVRMDIYNQLLASSYLNESEYELIYNNKLFIEYKFKLYNEIRISMDFFKNFFNYFKFDNGFRAIVRDYMIINNKK
ncbi:glycosyltransferase family 2 protein [Photobacterium kishitanii]|uniref:glycosyltransferase n=1 Tax=Photobacterium kishitanii TaxID=318456 RepID=UPI000D1510DB|nr:glycosyltransferase [Photobacterium kishitanii]PSV05547.1 glycosyltransferase family 2 protein [Photobacterium kishitanii]PSV72589.1 glycosyltransferase family 2 protein [Photobacterium kishitanii]